MQPRSGAMCTMKKLEASLGNADLQHAAQPALPRGGCFNALPAMCQQTVPQQCSHATVMKRLHMRKLP